MRLRGNKIILSKREEKAVKKAYQEVPYLPGEDLSVVDKRYLRLMELLEK